jgi:hypothetical protein
MSPRRDPKWIDLALKAYDACLPLYPREVREAHGEEMRQTFRDRCREVARGQRGAWQWFGEMAPDLIGSAAKAQWDGALGQQRGGQGLAVAMLVLSLLLLVFQDTVSSRLLDLTFKTRYAYFNKQAERIRSAEEGRVRGLADALAGESSAGSKAQAAFLYRTLYSSSLFYSAAVDSAGKAVMAARATDEGQGQVVFDRLFLGENLLMDGKSATVALHGVGSVDKGWIAAAAFQSCIPSAGCKPALAVARLTALEPDNAYGWSLAFKQAMQSNDGAGVRNALERMASARYYDDHFAEIRREVLGSALRLSANDAEARAAVARRLADGAYLGTYDFVKDARFQCSRRDPGQSPATWAESHPESEPGCLQFARVLSRSRNPFDALRGWTLIGQRDASASTRSALARARANYSASVTGVGSTHEAGSSRWEPWSDEQWTDWARAKYEGD